MEQILLTEMLNEDIRIAVWNNAFFFNQRQHFLLLFHPLLSSFCHLNTILRCHSFWLLMCFLWKNYSRCQSVLCKCSCFHYIKKYLQNTAFWFDCAMSCLNHVHKTFEIVYVRNIDDILFLFWNINVEFEILNDMHTSFGNDFISHFKHIHWTIIKKIVLSWLDEHRYWLTLQSTISRLRKSSTYKEPRALLLFEMNIEVHNTAKLFPRMQYSFCIFATTLSG